MQDDRPKDKFYHKKIKQVFLKTLLQPITNVNLQANAFRIIWRRQALIEECWEKIAEHRNTIDQWINGLSGVAFYISAVTAVFTKTSATRCVIDPVYYPAIGYWVVSEATEENRGILTHTLSSIIDTSDCIKPHPVLKEVISKGSESKAPADDDNESMLHPNLLFACLKDFNCGFVSRKLENSIRCCNLATDQRIVKCVCLNEAYKYQLISTCDALQAHGMIVDLVLEV